MTTYFETKLDYNKFIRCFVLAGVNFIRQFIEALDESSRK